MITYAGIPLIPPTPEEERWVEQHLPARGIMETSVTQWQGHGVRDMPMAWAIPERQHHLGTLYWPRGASQWAVGQFLASEEQLASVLEDTQGQAVARPLVLSAGADTIQTDLYLLPSRPLIQAGGRGVYLLTLVDRRFFWWATDTGTITVTGGVTTWDTLYQTIGGLLGVTITNDAVSPNYPLPSQALSAQFQAVPPLLDRVAYSAGQRIVVTLDGKVQALNWSSSEATLRSNLDAGHRRMAGGVFKFDPAAENELNALVPKSVRVLFPETSGGNLTGNEVAYDVSLADLALPQFFGVKGYDGRKVIHDDALDTAANLTSLARQVAADWYLHALASADARYDGVAPWQPEGLSGAVEWSYRTDAVSTRVFRGSWDPTSHLSHNGGSGSGPTYIINDYLIFVNQTVFVTNVTFNTTVVFNQDVTFNGDVTLTSLTLDSLTVNTSTTFKQSVTFDTTTVVNYQGIVNVTDGSWTVSNTTWNFGTVSVSQTVNFVHGSLVFPSTNNPAVAPLATLVIPTFNPGTPGTKPSYTPTSGELLCSGNWLWQAGGGTWTDPYTPTKVPTTPSVYYRTSIYNEANYRFELPDVIRMDQTNWRTGFNRQPDLTAGVVMESHTTSDHTLVLRGLSLQTGWMLRAEDQAGNLLTGLNQDGVLISGVTDEIVDSNLSSSEMAFLLDDSSGDPKLFVKGKDSSGAVQKTKFPFSAPASGELMIGNGADYTRATLTAGTGVTITNGAGSITISASGGGGGGITGSGTANHLVMWDSPGVSIKDSPATYDGSSNFALDTFNVTIKNSPYTVFDSAFGKCGLLGTTVDIGDTGSALGFFKAFASATGSTQQTLTGPLASATTVADLVTLLQNLVSILATSHNFLIDGTS